MHDVSSYDWPIDVSDKYETKNMLCGEHPEPVPKGSKIGSPDSGKACYEVPKRYNGLWAKI